MALRSCRVTILDLDGVAHSVEVTASTLYEAVAQGLVAIRGREWVAGVAEEIRTQAQRRRLGHPCGGIHR